MIENKWLPISIAPKDGTPILVCCVSKFKKAYMCIARFESRGAPEKVWLSDEGKMLDARFWVPLPVLPYELKVDELKQTIQKCCEHIEFEGKPKFNIDLEMNCISVKFQMSNELRKELGLDLPMLSEQKKSKEPEHAQVINPKKPEMNPSRLAAKEGNMDRCENCNFNLFDENFWVGCQGSEVYHCPNCHVETEFPQKIKNTE